MDTDRAWMACASSDYEQECGLILHSLKSQNFSQQRRGLDQTASLVKFARYLKINTNISLTLPKKWKKREHFLTYSVKKCPDIKARLTL